MIKELITISLLFNGLSFIEKNNFFYFDEIIPNDSKYEEQINAYEKIELSKAWELEKGDSSTLVGIIDSGIFLNHEDISNVNEQLSFDFTNNNVPFNDLLGHGTSIASIIGATCDNAIGIAGINWNVSMVSYKVSHNYVLQSELTSNVVDAINKAKEDNVKIINISASLLNTDELYLAIKNYPGLVVCSAGNDTLNTDIKLHYPSCYDLDNIISVGASSRSDTLTNFTNYGLNSVDLFAPGDYIECASINDGALDTYLKKSGTSFSTPMVTGVAALLLSNNPSLTTSELKDAILNNVDKIDALKDKCVTGGRLNAYKALMEIHEHKYSYTIVGVYHNSSCICGDTRIEDHTYNKWLYKNNLSHIESCVCNKVGTKTSVHIVKQSSIIGNASICIDCNAKLDLKSDIGMVEGDIVYVTLNGSYKLPSGIIVLKDTDYNSYINGTLSFNYNDDMLLS